MSKEVQPDSQNLLWREWRYCPDEAYGRELFALLGRSGPGLVGIAIIALFGTVYGLLVGYWFGLLLLGWRVDISLWTLEVGTVLVLTWLVGIGGGLLAAWAAMTLPWPVWLDVITPRSLGGMLKELSGHNSWLLLGFILGLLFGPVILAPAFVIFFMTGMRLRQWPGKQAEKDAAVALSLLLGVAGGSITWIDPWLSTATAILVGSWFGLTWVGLPLGLLLGGLGLGLTLAGRTLTSFESVGWLPAGLGFAVGVVVGLLPALAGRGLAPGEAHLYRPWYFWWQKQPPLTRVLIVLRDITSDARLAGTWAQPLRDLEERRAQPGEVPGLITALQNADWRERFVARGALTTLGGEAVEVLAEIAADPYGSLTETVVWVLTGIQEETTYRLGGRADTILCPHCLARFSRHFISLPWGGLSFTYYGCRICRQSRQFLDCPQGVVAVLDAGWDEDCQHQGGLLRINWLKRRALVDFDRVEIIQATDEDVERLAVQVGNDTDPFRRPRYARSACTVGPDCRLSDNTRRILDRTFGMPDHR